MRYRRCFSTHKGGYSTILKGLRRTLLGTISVHSWLLTGKKKRKRKMNNFFVNEPERCLSVLRDSFGANVASRYT